MTKRGTLPWVRVQPAKCGGKICYADKRNAVTSLNVQLRFRGRHGRGKELRIYQCPRCNGWHLTHQRPDGE